MASPSLGQNRYLISTTSPGAFAIGTSPSSTSLCYDEHLPNRSSRVRIRTPTLGLATQATQHVRIQSQFWDVWQQNAREHSLPVMYARMKESGRWDCLKLEWKEGMSNKPHRFWDSDIAKWLEAACYALKDKYDPSLGRIVEEAVDMIRRAQRDDGYINTYYTVVEPEKKWSEIAWSHEMYCAGHLLEAAVAHYEYSGSYRLLGPLLKYVEYIGSVFGTEDGKKKGYPGHEELELALIKAYEATGEESLLNLAKYFIEERGTKRPEGHYFDVEAAASGQPPRVGPGRGPPYSYHQADRPVQEMDSIEGHAVRAMYWLTGAAGVARHTEDEGLYDAVLRLWESTTHRKMYVTGGLGAMSDWEGFGPDYVLPNETGYLETCAAIGLVKFAHQMLHIEPRNMEYANVLELALYNAVLVGVSLDGKQFFYDNPLASVGKQISRSNWFEVACCPPNAIRLINSLGQFIYGLGADDTIFVYLYIGSTATFTLSDGEEISIRQLSGGPWAGGAQILVRGENEQRQYKLCFRKPPGGDYFLIFSEGSSLQTLEETKDYITVSISGSRESEQLVVVSFVFQPRLIRPHALDFENRGCVAVANGPIIYCAESVDNEDIRDLRLVRFIDSDNPRFEQTVDRSWWEKWKHFPVTLRADAVVLEDGANRETWKSTKLTLIPYCMWANRGKTDMRVWFATTKE